MIAAYQRISRADGDLGKDGKDKSNSIENQKELILRYISCKESLQNVPVMDFVDDGYTGSNFDRPGFQQMMDGVRNGKIDTIIVKDLSRFGRDYIGVGEYMEQIFPLLGVRLIAINDNYDSNNYKGTTLGMDVVVSNLVNTMYCRDAGKKLRTGVYIDITGNKEIYKRPEMVHLLKDCKNGSVNLIFSQTRAYIAANTCDFCFLLKYLFDLPMRVDIVTDDDDQRIDTILDFDNQRQSLKDLAEKYTSIRRKDYLEWRIRLEHEMTKAEKNERGRTV